MKRMAMNTARTSTSAKSRASCKTDDNRINIRISSALKADFEAAAAAEGTKSSAAIKKLMQKYVDEWHAHVGL